jgi:hypothetical protein
MFGELTQNPQLKHSRRRILRLLNAGAVLLLVFLVAVSLALILSAAGDDDGAAAVLGIVYVSVAGLLLDVVGLVIVTAIAVAALIEHRALETTVSDAAASDDGVT